MEMDCDRFPDNEWSDVVFEECAEPTVIYRSGLTVYEESLILGRFVGRGWNAAAFQAASWSGGYAFELDTDCYKTGEIDFMFRLTLFARPSLAFLKPAGFAWNPLVLARVRHWVDLYKNFIRPFMSTGRIYHHTPCVKGSDPRGWGVLELTSRDRARGICGVFQLSAPDQPEYLLRLRGLDLSRRYRVTFDNSGRSCEIDAFTLMKQGLTVRLEGALTSELLIFDAV